MARLMPAWQTSILCSEALKGGMAEVEMGQLAADKGSSEDVRKFGKKMVTDHTNSAIK